MGAIMKWNKETVNIIYASNDGYAGHLAASLVSLLENNRQIPHMHVYVLSVNMCGLYKERLRRIAEGPLTLGELPTGAWRPLNGQELEALERALEGR